MKRTLMMALIAACSAAALYGCSTGTESAAPHKSELERVIDSSQFAQEMGVGVNLMFVGCQGKLHIPSALALVEQNLERIHDCVEERNRAIGLESRSRLDEGLLKPEEVASFVISTSLQFAQNNNDKAAALSSEELIAFVKSTGADKWPVLPD